MGSEEVETESTAHTKEFAWEGKKRDLLRARGRGGYREASNIRGNLYRLLDLAEDTGLQDAVVGGGGKWGWMMWQSSRKGRKQQDQEH